MPPLSPPRSYVAEQVERMTERQLRTLTTLAQHGWYIEPSIVETVAEHAAHFFAKGDNEKANGLMCEVVEHVLGVAEAALCDDYPARADVIRQAFGAHRRGEFALSVPVMLSQADGICSDIFGVQLYARKHGARLEDKLGEQLGMPGALRNIFLEPLVRPHLVALNERERKGVPLDAFNRHAILHGEALGYGTHANGCRAVSHLRYVGWILKRYAPDPDDVSGPPGG